MSRTKQSMSLLLLFILLIVKNIEGEPPDLPQANQIHQHVHKESLYSWMRPSVVSTTTSSENEVKNSHHGQKITTESIPTLDSRDDFRKGTRVHPLIQHQIVFAVQQNNANEIKRLLHEVSDPFSPTYGNHLTRAAIAKLTSNPTSAVAIKSFLTEQGATIASETVYGEYIVAEGSVQLWERLLSAEFYHYESVIEERGYDPKVSQFIRCKQYTIPEALQSHVFAIHNTVQMPLRSKRPFVARSGTDSTVTATTTITETSDKQPRVNGTVSSSLPYTSINTLNRIYSIGSNRGHPLATQGVYEALNQSYSPSDLRKFQRIFNLPEQTIATDIGHHVYFQNCTFGLCGEANLDVQYIMAVAQDSPTTYYYTDESFGAWLMSMANMTNPPQVMSISYGGPEFYNTVSEKRGFNMEAMKLGLAGVTLLVASGDDGVGNFIVRNSPGLCGYFSDYPSGSPYVTAVGATQGAESGKPEVTCQSDNTPSGVITSGGGFSDFNPRPSWQAAVVDAYLSSVLHTPHQPVGGYNSMGRGYPDISAAGLHYHVVIGGVSYHVSGTSASCPVVAAMITLVNSARIKAGQSTVGWLNPALYAFHRNFTNDVTKGHNKCGADNVVCCEQGFYAGAGWDPATGLGTLNFTSFKHTLMNLPKPTSTSPAANAPTPSPVPYPPSPAPSPVPTAYPTLAPGYAFITHYSDKKCGATAKAVVERVEGYSTGVCLPNYERQPAEDGQGSVLQLNGYVRYSCSEEGVLMHLYSDENCESLEDDFSYAIVYVPHSLCATVHHDSVFLGDRRNWTTSAVAQCAPHSHSVSSLLPVPVPTTSLTSSSGTIPPNPNQFVVAKDFASGAGDCSDPQLLSDFFATRNRYCHRAYGQSSFQSYLLLYPYVYFYLDYDCNPDNLLGSGSFPPVCEATEPDPFYYFAQGGVTVSSFFLYN